jgi:multicomponent Na+:H+ antiporter subunit B
LKALSLLLALFVGFLLIGVLDDLPAWGDAKSPANSYVSAYYLKNSMEQTHVPNVVTAVLADYRGFDTMFETGVVFVAVIGIMAILRRDPKEEDSETGDRPPHAPPEGFILGVATRFIVPFMQMFALYVIAHGHHSPGGGFQGGVILGASLILMAMTGELESALDRMREKWFIVLVAGGFLLYAGVGLGCMFFGGNFLDYSALAPLLGGDPKAAAIMARYHGMLWVEIGVAFTVMSSMFAIFAYLSSDGRMDRGL